MTALDVAIWSAAAGAIALVVMVCLVDWVLVRTKAALGPREWRIELAHMKLADRVDVVQIPDIECPQAGARLTTVVVIVLLVHDQGDVPPGKRERHAHHSMCRFPV